MLLHCHQHHHAHRHRPGHLRGPRAARSSDRLLLEIYGFCWWRLHGPASPTCSAQVGSCESLRSHQITKREVALDALVVVVVAHMVAASSLPLLMPLLQAGGGGTSMTTIWMRQKQIIRRTRRSLKFGSRNAGLILFLTLLTQELAVAIRHHASGFRIRLLVFDFHEHRLTGILFGIHHAGETAG